MSIEQLLSIPVDDITELPTVTEEDVSVVVKELKVILNKCLYCIRRRLPVPLEVMMSIICQAATCDPDRVFRGLLQRADEGRCLDILLEVCAQILHIVNAQLRLAFDMDVFFELLQMACGAALLKEKIGVVMGKLLLGFMHDVAQHADDYRVHRNCASALITLLRSSKCNKNCIAADCDVIAESLEQSTDFFFQMQCVELLFRLYTHNHAALAQVRMNDFLRRGIASLPNDATLLISIQALLDNYNAEYHANSILAFTVVRLEVDGQEVCTHTTMYFSSVLLVAMLPGGAGENITIPFEHVRSVKLSKDRKLGLRLNTIPDRLSSVMQTAEGKDTLQAFFTQSSLEQLKSCEVHHWISDRKRHAPRRTAQVLSRAAAPAAVAASKESVTNLGAISERHQQSSHADQTKSDKQPTPSDGGSLADLHYAASVKASRYRLEQQEGLQHATDTVQELLAEMRTQNARERDGCEAALREDMAAIRRAEAVVKESAAEHVRVLNTELEDVQALGALLKAETDRLRERIAKSVGRSEGVEEACLVGLKRLVDTQMKEIERTLSRFMADANPLSAVGEHLASRIDGSQAGAGSHGPSSKTRRLEYA